MNTRLLAALEAQGARCGHIDGRARCGVYVIGEEHMYSLEAALANTKERRADWAHQRYVQAWANGYAAGYRVGADGMALDPETMDHELPEEAAP